MVALPPRPTQVIIDRIYRAYEQAEAAENPGMYLGRIGSSFLGEACIRKGWLGWRGYSRETFEGRMLRLFGTGHWQEARIVDDLRKAGFEVFDKQEDGSQFAFGDSTGHFVTKMDGVIKGVPDSEKTPHALEIKTHNKASFEQLVKKGVEYSKPVHWGQVLSTMEFSKLTRTIYVGVCKDDERIYVERIKEDKPAQKKLTEKIITLVTAKMRPAGISDKADSFDCKFCSQKAVCLKQVAPLRHCRTCRSAVPSAEGTWTCEKAGTTLSLEEQKAGCPAYEEL